MADPPIPDTGDDTGVEPDRGATTGTSSWQKMVGIIGIVVVLWVGDRMYDTVSSADPGGPGSGQHAPGGDSTTPMGGNTPLIDAAPAVAVTADALAFDPDRIELTAGEPVNVALTAADSLHDLTVDEIDFHLAADRDETVIGGLMVFEPGAYLGYCSVPGHREAGMEIEIVVTSSSAVTDQSAGTTPAAPTGTSSPPTAVGSTPSSIPVVSVSGTEYSFDAPDTIAAGLTTVRFTNRGQDAHELQLMRLNDGVAIHQFMGTFAQGVDAALGLVSVEGGVEAIGPGQTAEVTVDLPEGDYVLISLVASPDDGVPDALKRMVKPLTVTAAP